MNRLKINHAKVVSTIVPCYNSATFLAEAISSILAQTYSHFEIIIIDDGSTDNTQEVAANFPVKYIYQQNQGVVAARNRGVKEALGELLVFLDADDILLPKAFEIGVDAICTYPQSGFVAGFCQEINADGLIVSRSNSPPIKVANYQTLLMGEAFVPPSVLMFQRTAIELVRGFEAKWVQGAEDYDLYLRIARQFPIYCHNKIIVQYRRHDDNASNNALNMLQGCLKVLDSHWKFVQGNPEYEEAYQVGRKHWIDLFGPFLIPQSIAYLKSKSWLKAIKVLLFQLIIYPQGFYEYFLSKAFIKSLIIKYIKFK